MKLERNTEDKAYIAGSRVSENWSAVRLFSLRVHARTSRTKNSVLSTNWIFHSFKWKSCLLTCTTWILTLSTRVKCSCSKYRAWMDILLAKTRYSSLLQLVYLGLHLSLESHYWLTNFFKECLKWISVEKGECIVVGELLNGFQMTCEALVKRERVVRQPLLE